MGNTTLGNIILQGDGKAFIIENNARKEATLTPQPLYLMDSDQTDVFDFGGVTKTITLSGKFVGDSISDCKSFIDSVEALIQGHQDVDAGYPITFTDDLRGTIKVKIMDFDSTWIEGEPHEISWTLKLIESSENI